MQRSLPPSQALTSDELQPVSLPFFRDSFIQNIFIFWTVRPNFESFSLLDFTKLDPKLIGFDELFSRICVHFSLVFTRGFHSFLLFFSIFYFLFLIHFSFLFFSLEYMNFLKFETFIKIDELFSNPWFLFKIWWFFLNLCTFLKFMNSFWIRGF